MTPKVVRDIVERVTVMRDEATQRAEETQNLWTGRDIRGTINELLLTAMVSRVHTLDDVLAAIEAETEDNPPERGED